MTDHYIEIPTTPEYVPGELWCSTQQLVDIWPEINDILDTHQIEIYMQAAQIACEAFAPVLAAGTPIPPNYTLAVAQQTRNMYNASKVDSGTFSQGEGEFSYQPHPLDWSIKQLLRPKTGRPLVG